jgi:hypothetical protein
MKVLDIQYDNVIDSVYLTIKTDYQFAFNHLISLLDKFDQQRNTLRPSFYQKLERDLIDGCIIPPLTIALIGEADMNKYQEMGDDELTEEFNDAFVLDGIQRLNTMRRIGIDGLDLTRPLYINLIVCGSMDKLLYRMITLNNGQKPMSARHQVEIITNNIYDFNSLNLEIQTEKEKGKKSIKGAFNKSDIVQAYLAFISNSINIDNKKIIESKMDELISMRIMDSGITKRDITFSDVIKSVEYYVTEPDLNKWFTNSNNLIGFAVAFIKSSDTILNVTVEEMKIAIEKFELAFSYINVSKVKVGTARRKAVKYFIENFNSSNQLDEIELTDLISMEI